MIERARGCLLGLAVGDALGAPYEGWPAAAIPERIEFQGMWTDDTAMALCIAESLATRGIFDADDIAARFVAWIESDPPDAGITTRIVLGRIARGQHWMEAAEAVYRASPGSTAGNGALMRTAPLSLFFVSDDARLQEAATICAQITHHHPEAVGPAVAGALIMAALVRGEPLADAVAHARERVPAMRRWLAPEAKEARELSGSGYAPTTLESALWCAMREPDAERAMVRAVRFGEDADTVAAVAGALVGARDGEAALPEAWRARLHEGERIGALAQKLLRA